MADLICETLRLQLRKIIDQDADALFQILGDPEVMKFSVHGPESMDGIRQFIAATMRRYDRDGVAQWAVIHKDSGILIGECGISVQTIDNQKEFEIGYRFNSRYWGQGYGSESAIACRDYGFEGLNLTRLISIIETENKASIGVAKKMGMTLEKKSVFHDIPVEIYSLTKKSIRPSMPID